MAEQPNPELKAKADALAKQIFEEVDTAKTGKIDLKELTAILDKFCDQMGFQQPTEDDIKPILDDLSSQHDGNITFDQLQWIFEQLFEDIAAMKNQQ